MSRKSAIHGYRLFNSVSLGADATSEETTVFQQDQCSIAVSWSGDAVGVLYVQVKNGENEEYRNLDLGATVTIDTLQGYSHEIQFTQMPFSNMRLFFDRTSGTGTITAVITSKSVGG